MNFRLLLIAVLSLVSCAMYGCGGSGGQGLNGSLALTATTTGAVVTGTATYTNPTAVDVTGTPISIISDKFGPIVSTGANSLGVVPFSFTPTPFIGTQTFTIIATSSNLSAFFPITMNGITMTMAAPPAQTVTLTGGVPGAPFTFVFASPTFVTIADPFNNNVSNHLVNMTATFSVAPSAAGDLLTFGATNAGAGVTATATATTGPAGTVPLPGTSLALIIPAVGATRTATITWTATVSNADPNPVFRGLAASGSTVVTLTN